MTKKREPLKPVENERLKKLRQSGYRLAQLLAKNLQNVRKRRH